MYVRLGCVYNFWTPKAKNKESADSNTNRPTKGFPDAITKTKDNSNDSFDQTESKSVVGNRNRREWSRISTENIGTTDSNWYWLRRTRFWLIPALKFLRKKKSRVHRSKKWSWFLLVTRSDRAEIFFIARTKKKVSVGERGAIKKIVELKTLDLFKG